MSHRFGWSYPPGCSGPPDNDFDDTVCAVCDKPLPEGQPVPGSLAYDGFCSEACKAKYEERNPDQPENFEGGDF